MQVNIYACSRTYGNKKDNSGTFDFCSIFIEDKLQPVNRSNYHKEGKGFLQSELIVSQAVYDKLMKHDLPIKAELVTEGKLVSGKLRTSIVDIKPIK